MIRDGTPEVMALYSPSIYLPSYNQNCVEKQGKRIAALECSMK